jgi:hypothetical protein
MNKKIIAIGIISLFLIIVLSTSAETIEKEPIEITELVEYKGTHLMLKSIGLNGEGFALKSFWNRNSNMPFIMFAHYGSLDYGFFITRDGDRTDFDESCNIIIVGFSFGDILNSLGIDAYHEGYGNWFGFFEPVSSNLMIDIQYPFFVYIF